MCRIFTSVLVFLCSLLIFASPSLAQEQGKASKKFSLSIFGGANNGKLSYESLTYNGFPIPVPESERKWRPYFGIETNYWLSDKFALMLRPAYVAKGSYEHNQIRVVIDGERYDVDATEDVTLEYIQIPLGVRGVFGRGKMKTSFLIAPRLDIQLSAKDHITYENTTENISGNTTVDVPDLNKVVFGFIIGTSLGVEVSKDLMISLEALYDHGLDDIVLNPDFYPDVNTNDYRVGISFMYHFE